MRNSSDSPRGGFTLVELLVVIAIIGLIISLILVAAADGVRRAEERATQALITKLETALNDRLDALLNTTPPINVWHRYLARIGTSDPNADSYNRRAQVIAQFDYLRAELPDVFFLNALTKDGGSVAGSYPLNFAAAPFPAGSNNLSNFVLPLGVGLDSLGNPGGIQEQSSSLVSPLSAANQTPVTGMFGASFSAAGGLYKQLGYLPAGYDGVDNNGNGYIDEAAEGGPSVNLAQLNSHRHNTARAEVLYAVLVEGLGPLGSAFNRDDFTSKEVQDTDGDGLLEFVDSWGQPLQFYRWPIYYGTAAGSSDSQKASNPYNGVSETRQLDPLDPNQMLTSPGWWSSASNPSLVPAAGYQPPNGNSTSLCGQSSIAFMNYFHILVDPQPPKTATGASWDRTGFFNRRAYYSRFLILSGGPDQQPGVAQLNLDYEPLISGGLTPGSNIFPFPNGSATMEANALYLTYIENQAAQADPSSRQGSFYESPQALTPTTIYLQTNAALDDISNQNVSAPSTGVR